MNPLLWLVNSLPWLATSGGVHAGNRHWYILSQNSVRVNTILMTSSTVSMSPQNATLDLWAQYLGVPVSGFAHFVTIHDACRARARGQTSAAAPA